MLSGKVKRRVFISYCHRDETEVENFIDQWAIKGDLFTPYALGVSDEDDFINSSDTEYVMSQIRQNYLRDTSVTLLLVGKCTHSRRYVDWELKASLRSGPKVTPNGVLGILLPSCKDIPTYLPERFKDNWNREEKDCYARYRYAPESAESLVGWIEDAVSAISTRAKWIKNEQDKMGYNSTCKACGITH